MASDQKDLEKVEVDSPNKAGKLPLYDSSWSKSQMGLIVLQEWWGVNQQIQNRALFFASHGFHVVIPDLYRGKVAKNHEEAGHYMGNLDWPGAVQDINVAAEYLKSQGVKKVGVVGYCMGGALALAGAALCESVSAAVPYYGVPDKKLADLTKVKVPVQGHFGALDTAKGFSDSTAVKALEEALKQSGAEFEIFVYEDAGHAFANELRPDAFHKPSYEKATERTLAFFNKHLV